MKVPLRIARPPRSQQLTHSPTHSHDFDDRTAPRRFWALEQRRLTLSRIGQMSGIGKGKQNPRQGDVSKRGQKRKHKNWAAVEGKRLFINIFVLVSRPVPALFLSAFRPCYGKRKILKESFLLLLLPLVFNTALSTRGIRNGVGMTSLQSMVRSLFFFSSAAFAARIGRFRICFWCERAFLRVYR